MTDDKIAPAPRPRPPYAYKLALQQLRERYKFDGWVDDHAAQRMLDRGWDASDVERRIQALGEGCSLSALLAYPR